MNAVRRVRSGIGAALTDGLLTIAGANRAALEHAPRDRVKQASLGGAILTTAGLAAVSAAVALVMAFDLELPYAAAAAVVWGVAILNLDRWLVVASPRQAHPLATLMMAVPRLSLAVVIGLVVSTPLTLQVFDAEIQTQLQQQNRQARADFDRQLSADGRFSSIPAWEEEIRALEDGVSAGSAVSVAVASDPALVRLQDDFETKDAEYTAAESAVTCELEGRPECGSGRPGDGPVTRLKIEQRDRLRAERDRLQSQLDALQASLTGSAQVAADESTRTREARLDSLRTSLAVAQGQRADEQRAFDSAVGSSDGLLARLDALQRLEDGSPTMKNAHYAVFLFLTLLECLPILFKTLLSLGRPSLYDEVIVMEDTRAKNLLRWKQKAAEAEVKLTTDAAIEAAQTHESSRLKAEVRAAELVLDAQVSLTRTAVATWKQKQKQLIEDDVDAFVSSSPAAIRVERSRRAATDQRFSAAGDRTRGSAFAQQADAAPPATAREGREQPPDERADVTLDRSSPAPRPRTPRVSLHKTYAPTFEDARS